MPGTDYKLLDLDRAMKDPSSVFSSPDEIASSTVLTKEQKLELLEVWKQNAIQLQRAASEGMDGGEDNRLSQVKKAIEKVGRL